MDVFPNDPGFALFYRHNNTHEDQFAKRETLTRELLSHYADCKKHIISQHGRGHLPGLLLDEESPAKQLVFTATNTFGFDSSEKIEDRRKRTSDPVFLTAETPRDEAATLTDKRKIVHALLAGRGFDDAAVAVSMAKTTHGLLADSMMRECFPEPCRISKTNGGRAF